MQIKHGPRVGQVVWHAGYATITITARSDQANETEGDLIEPLRDIYERVVTLGTEVKAEAGEIQAGG